MTYKELSDAFDVYANRHAEVKLGSLLFFDEYEKSLFLTMAANELVKEMLPFYERNEKIEKQLLDITKSAQVATLYSLSDDNRFKVGSLVYELPSDVLYIVAESLRSSANAILRRIKPLKDDEAYYTLDNPFRVSTHGYAYRNDVSFVVSGTNKRYAEIISDLTSTTAPEYYLKYIAMVPPFIVTDTLLDAKIGNTSTNSNLNVEAPLSMLHEKILNRAILIGFMAKSDEPNSKVAISTLSKDS
jgi:hypothetical protein